MRRLALRARADDRTTAGVTAEKLPVEINKRNVWRIAERIVSNELEARGFRVSALNKQGLAANADLLASRCKFARNSDPVRGGFRVQ